MLLSELVDQYMKLPKVMFSKKSGGLLGKSDGIGDRTQHLGSTPEAVGILHPGIVLPVGFTDLAVLQQLAHQRRRPTLTRVWAGLVDARIEGSRRSAQRFQGHRCRSDRGAPEYLRVVHHHRQHRRLRLGAIDEGNALLRGKAIGREPGSLESCPGGRGRGFTGEHLALAHQRKSDVTQRCQVSAGPNTSLLGNQGNDSGIEQGYQRVHQLRTHAAGRPQQHVRAKQHHTPHHRWVQRSPDAGRVTANEIGLELIELVGGDPDVCQLSESGIDPVDRLARLNRPLDQLPTLG